MPKHYFKRMKSWHLPNIIRMVYRLTFIHSNLLF